MWQAQAEHQALGAEEVDPAVAEEVEATVTSTTRA